MQDAKQNKNTLASLLLSINKTIMTNFLPAEYKIPSSNNYMRLKDGANKFRVLSSAITGHEYWNNENQPVRSKEVPKETTDIKMVKVKKKNGEEVLEKSKVKHFWAFIVWNYDVNAVQILQITQATIQEPMLAIVNDTAWGDPKGYDITIKKQGEGLQTQYTVVPNPHKEIEADIIKTYENGKINLEALYTGEEPFNNEAPTPEEGDIDTSGVY